MMKKSKQWLVALGVATTIAASGIAMAATTDKQSGTDCRGGKHQGQKEFRQHQVKLLEYLQMDRETFRAERQAGKSLAAIAASRGISEQDLTSFLTGQMNERLAEGVKSGRISEERAAQMKAAMPTRIADMIKNAGAMHQGPTGKWGSGSMANGQRGHGPMADGKLLELLKIDTATFRSEMQAGKSLTAIAQERGVPQQELKDFLVARMVQRIDDGVANGRIDAAKAAEMKIHVEDRVTAMMTGKGMLHHGQGMMAKPQQQ